MNCAVPPLGEYIIWLFAVRRNQDVALLFKIDHGWEELYMFYKSSLLYELLYDIL